MALEAQGRPEMKVIERVRYGQRGEGSLIRYDGVENWFSSYSAHGKEIRQTTGTADLKMAKKFHRGVLDGLAADRQGLRTFIAPSKQHKTVAEMVTDLVADYTLRGVRSLAQVHSHPGLPRKDGQPRRKTLRPFGTGRVGEVTREAVARYTQRRADEKARPATINRETQLLGQALRLAVRRG